MKIRKVAYWMCFLIFVQIYKMQRLLFSILLSFFVFASCSKSLPDGILKEKEMSSLLKEVHLTDAYLNTLPIDSSKKVINSHYDQIFKQYGLDSASFALNMEYYLARPTLAEKVYDNLLTDLKEDQRAWVERDSIKSARTQDSTNRVQRLINEYLNKKELISNVRIDSTALTYQGYQDYFYSQIPFRFNVYGRDIPIQVSPKIVSPLPSNQDSVAVPSGDVPALIKDSVAASSLSLPAGRSSIPLKIKPVNR